MGKFNWLDVLGDVSRNKVILGRDLCFGFKHDKEVFELQQNRLQGGKF